MIFNVFYIFLYCLMNWFLFENFSIFFHFFVMVFEKVFEMLLFIQIFIVFFREKNWNLYWIIHHVKYDLWCGYCMVCIHWFSDFGYLDLLQSSFMKGVYYDEGVQLKQQKGTAKKNGSQVLVEILNRPSGLKV